LFNSSRFFGLRSTTGPTFVDRSTVLLLVPASLGHPRRHPDRNRILRERRLASGAARDGDEAASCAEPILAQGVSVAVKIHSRDITHKSDIGGVILNLASKESVRDAATEVIARARRTRPGARIEGVIIQPMVARQGARELLLGLADDPTFGPVLVFGHGGTAVEVVKDKTLALPPLDLNLARDLVGRTAVARLLAAYRDVPAVPPDSVPLTGQTCTTGRRPCRGKRT
jgi:hypothetical protein